jgi:hypothetical protein
MTSEELKREFARMAGEKFVREEWGDLILTRGDLPDSENGTGIDPALAVRLLAGIMVVHKPNKLEELKHAGDN